MDLRISFLSASSGVGLSGLEPSVLVDPWDLGVMAPC